MVLRFNLQTRQVIYLNRTAVLLIKIRTMMRATLSIAWPGFRSALGEFKRFRCAGGGSGHPSRRDVLKSMMLMRWNQSLARFQGTTVVDFAWVLIIADQLQKMHAHTVCTSPLCKFLLFHTWLIVYCVLLRECNFLFSLFSVVTFSMAIASSAVYILHALCLRMLLKFSDIDCCPPSYLFASFGVELDVS